MILTFIIVTVSDNQFLQNLLKSINNQNIKNYEIIIVSNNSVQIKKELKFNNIITSEENPGEKRNIGANKAKGQFLIFVDDDTILPKNYTKNIKLLIGKNKKVFGGPGIIPKNENNFNKMLSLFLINKKINPLAYRYNFDKRKNVNELPTSNLIIDKKLFFDVKGFNKDIWPGEDTDFCYRVNKIEKIYYNPIVYNFHFRRSSIVKLLRQFFRYGFYRYKVDKLKMELKYFFPAIFFLVSSLLVISCILYKDFKALFLMLLIFLFFINLLQIKNIKKNKCYLLTPISTFLILISYGLGIIISIFKSTNVKYFR